MSFFPNTNNLLAFFIVFEWGRILESAMDKQEVKCNAKLRNSYFSVNVLVLAVVFRRQKRFMKKANRGDLLKKKFE